MCARSAIGIYCRLCLVVCYVIKGCRSNVVYFTKLTCAHIVSRRSMTTTYKKRGSIDIRMYINLLTLNWGVHLPFMHHLKLVAIEFQLLTITH